MLSEGEEQLISLLIQPADIMWEQSLRKELYKQTIKFNGKEYSFNETLSELAKLPVLQRRKLYEKIKQKTINVSDIAESELNAIYTTKKIIDEKKHFSKPYSSRVLDNHDDEKTVEDLIDIVTKNFKLSQRFFKVKAKLLKLEALKFSDANAIVGKIKHKYTFKESYEIIRTILQNTDQEFVDILDKLVRNGQIDVFAKKGKSSTAQISVPNMPPFIMLNHNDTLDSLRAFAHELGHAIHSSLTVKNQPAIYQDYTISVAETASTFFEGLIFDEVTKKLPDSQKIITLHDKTLDEIRSIFAQTMGFNFELEAHTKVRQQGMLSKEKLSKIMNKHIKQYIGPILDLEETDGYYWVQWPHLRTPFYVYTYVFGNLVSSALRHEYYQNHDFIKNIKEFLSAGSSDTTENIFKKAGITINKKFFENGIKEIEKDIIELERLVK